MPRARVTIPAALALAALLATGCSSEPAIVESADDSTTTTSTSIPTSMVGATASTSTSVTSTTTTTTPTTSTMATVPPTTVPPELPLVSGRVTSVGHFHLPDGEFVKITDGEDADAECTAGRLGVRIGQDVVHVYDELGDVYGLEVHHGFYGQTAIVDSCEESILRLLFSSTAVPPPDGVPEIVVGPVAPEVLLLADLAWRTTGFLHARATFFTDTGWNDDVVFDAFDGSMRSLEDVLGERRRLAPGLDAIVPSGWVIADGDPALETVEIVDSASPASVTITISPERLPESEPVGDEVLRYTNLELVDLWEPLGDGRARTSGDVRDAADSWFSGAEGDRLVRTIDLDERTIRIDARTPASAGAGADALANLVLEHVRIYAEAA